jgi:hypothetical protein
MSKHIINELSRMKDIFGYKRGVVISEQAVGGTLVPSSVYDAIKEIEARYSFMDNGEINGATYSGNKIEGDFKKYIEKYIGLENWFKMNDKLRAQIYAYAFQSDSGEGGVYKNKWIAGLAQAIGNYNRSKISNQNIGTKEKPKFMPVNDPKVQEAINIVKAACQDGTINSYYEKYLSVLDQQYKSSDFYDNYKYIWKYRPKAVERLIAGEDKDIVFSDWEKSFDDVSENTISITTSSDLIDFADKIATQTEGKDLNLDTIKLDMKKFTFSVQPGDTSVLKLVLRWNMPNEKTCESCINTISKNTKYGAKAIKEGTFKNDTLIYNLIVLYK